MVFGAKAAKGVDAGDAGCAGTVEGRSSEGLMALGSRALSALVLVLPGGLMRARCLATREEGVWAVTVKARI